MNSQELILSACSAKGSVASGSKTASTAAIHLHDLATTAPVQAFKTSNSAAECLATVASRDGQGGTIWAVQEGKAIAGVWAWQKDQQHLKIHLPERLSCIATSPNGVWIAGGSPNGQVYLWEIASGLMLASWNAHYRNVISLTFTGDSTMLVTASSDASAHVFLVSRLLDDDSSSPYGKPYGSLGDHTLGITGVALGKTAGINGGRCWTISEDGTVKMWSLNAPFDLLATFTLPPSVVPTSIVVDATERFLYVGCKKGDVYLIPLYRRKGQMGQAEAVGGEGAGSPPIKVDSPVIHVDSAVTCLSLSLTASFLLVGTASGDISIHSLPSHQHVRTLSSHGGAITHLSTLTYPPDLVGKPFRAEDWAIMDIKNLERMRASRTAQDSQEVSIILRPSKVSDRLLSLRGGVVASSPSARPVENGTQDDTAALHNEIKRLRTALDKAVKTNEKMWNGIVDLKMGS